MKMVVFALTLVRHAETGYNKLNVIQGQADVPLSVTGESQAKLLANRLQNQKYSHIYASDLLRALKTAEFVLRENLSSSISITKDDRLRERKFGDVEGKSYQSLREEAKKQNQTIAAFTPPGAETISQVRTRAISFFEDLCENILKSEIQEKTKHDAKRQKCDGPGCNNVPTTNSTNILNKSELTKSTTIDCDIGKTEQDDEPSESGERVDDFVGTNMRRTIEDTGKIDGCNAKQENLQNDTFVENNLPNDRRHDCDQSRGNHESDANRDDQINDDSGGPTTDKKYDVNSNLPSEMKSLSFMKQGGSTTDDQIVAKSVDHKDGHTNFMLTFSDSSIRSRIHRSCSSRMNPNDECPNVSLSPLIEKQMSPFCSPNKVQPSTRKISVDSCDDDEDIPPKISANILVVSHGGFLREIFRHFVDELDCAIPGGKAQALRTTPNTGISRFTVSIQPSDRKIRVTCLEIHDKDHLTCPQMA